VRAARCLRFLAACIAAYIAALALSAHAAKPDPVHTYRFEIVTTDNGTLTRRIVEDLVPRLVPLFSNFRTELAQRRRMLYVAIGPDALRQVAARRCDCVVVSAFTSSQVYHAIANASPAHAAMTAVYAEPAPADQLRLTALLYRRPVRVAAILGPDTAFLKPLLDDGSVTVLDASDDLAADGPATGAGAAINRLLNRIAQTDVLLALPDSAIYNADNVRNILLSTYRHKQGVIGFSGDMVRAGALATTYSDIEDINAQVAEVVAEYVAGGELAAPHFPRYFRTVVNEGVARSLDIDVTPAVRGFARRPPAERKEQRRGERQ
jgi:hypothetical protein